MDKHRNVLTRGEQMKLDMEHVVQCPMCGDVFPEVDVHPDDQLCIECEGDWVDIVSYAYERTDDDTRSK